MKESGRVGDGARGRAWIRIGVVLARWKPWVEIGENESVPLLLGVASKAGRRTTTLCVLIPFNLVVAVLVRLYWWLSFPGFALNTEDPAGRGMRMGWYRALNEMESFVVSWKNKVPDAELVLRIIAKVHEMQIMGVKR